MVLLATLYLPLAFLMSWHIGKAQAMREDRFLVAARGAVQEAVLRTYGDRMVLGALDPTGTRLTSDLRVVDISDLGESVMRWQTVAERNSK